MVMAGDAEAQHTQDLKATTSPVLWLLGGTSQRFPASHIPLLPLWGCLCPPSLPLPLPTLDLEASHRTKRGWLCHISLHGEEPRPGAPRRPTSVLHDTGIASTLEPFPRAKMLEFGLGRMAVPGPTGSRTLELLFLLLGPGPLPTDLSETPGPADGHVPLGTTGEGAASTPSPLFFVPLNPISTWDIQVWRDKTPTQAAAEAMPHTWGTPVPEPGVTKDRDWQSLECPVEPGWVPGNTRICLGREGRCSPRGWDGSSRRLSLPSRSCAGGDLGYFTVTSP